MALNKIFLQGRLTADPELRKTGAGNSFINFNIAVNRNYKSKDGTVPTDFFKVFANGSRAEFVTKYFHKGDEIIVVGSIETSRYEDKDGNKRLDTYINADEFQFGAKKATATEPEKITEYGNDAEFFEEIGNGELPF